MWCLFIGREQGMCHGCAYMRPGWDLEACCFWPFLEHSSCDPPPQVAESEVSTGPLYGPSGFRHPTGRPEILEQDQADREIG